MKPTIYIRLAGGLGNQLFQFSAAYTLAIQQGLSAENIIIDTRFLSSYETKNKFEIGFISNQFQGIQVATHLPFIVSFASRFRLAKIIDRTIGQYNLISSIDHLKILLDKKNSLQYILDGYFQSPEIVFDQEECSRIRSFLHREKKAVLSPITKGLPTIGIHIRRGDYVTSKSASRVFRNIPLEYYYAALNRLNDNNLILVFSDDPELSASFAAGVGGVNVRQFNLSLEDEFCLLMCCDDHVIANSTFSWWAAYLGHRPGRQVISPKNWYFDIARSQANPLLLPHFDLIDA